MTAAIIPFNYTDETQVRTLLIDGEPWFVLADLCTVLGINNVGNVSGRIDQAGIRQADISSSGQRRSVTVVSEAGMYEVVIRSDKPEAVNFRRWLTGTVLPEIRRTGAYSVEPQLTPAQRMAAAVIEAQSIIKAKDQRIAELEPSARAWDELADASGDYDTRAAAQIISRSGVEIGQNRLRAHMRQIGWTDSNNRPYQAAVKCGRLAEKVRRWEDRESGEVHIDHQLRVTAKGVGELLAKLAGVTQLEVVRGGAS